jgi:beta-glucosidase
MVAARGSGDGTNAAPGGNALTDPTTANDQRAAALLAQLTTDEKIQLVHGTGIPVFGVGEPFTPGVSGARGISRGSRGSEFPRSPALSPPEV